MWRSEHDARVADLKAVIAMCDEDLRESREERRELQSQLQQMRMLGAVPAPVTPVAPPVTPLLARDPEDDELRALIGEVCGKDLQKRGMMLRQLAADRAAKKPADDIRAAIVNGIQGNGVPL